MLDCDIYSRGCRGGMATSGFQYIKRSGGLMLRTDYRYFGFKSKCVFNPALVAVKVAGYVSAGTYDESRIKQMLYKLGPLAVAINAGPLQYYTGGVLDISSSRCNPRNLNHAVTLVGYGTTTNGIPYWIVRNSWGPYWGEAGYFRVKQGSGVCGINRFVASAILK
jgi:C1A family cysteine protease